MSKGFTLIELLAVLLIITILTAIALPQYRKMMERSYVAEARQVLPAIYDSMTRWAIEQGCNSSWVYCSNISFAKLDVSLKGEIRANNPKKWDTPNFTYTIHTSKMIGAMRRGEGRFKGLKINYNGADFSCNDMDMDNPKYQYKVCSDILDFDKLDTHEGEGTSDPY